MLGTTLHPFRVSASPTTLAALLLAVDICPAVQAQQQDRPAGPPMIFSAALPDVPGTNLQIVELNFAPNSGTPSTVDDHGPGHRHPGSVLVYVVEGSVRLAIAGEPVRVVHAGETFFEPPEAHHVITENASATEPAKAIAIMLVPEGEPHIHP